MMSNNISIYILIMAFATYLVRAIPMTVIRGEIKNPFLKSFLHYVPYATISSMILPDILFCTASIVSAVAGLIVALYFSYKEKDLIVVSFFACLAVFIADKIMSLE